MDYTVLHFICTSRQHQSWYGQPGKGIIHFSGLGGLLGRRCHFSVCSFGSGPHTLYLTLGRCVGWLLLSLTPIYDETANNMGYSISSVNQSIKNAKTSHADRPTHQGPAQHLPLRTKRHTTACRPTRCTLPLGLHEATHCNTA